MELSLDDMPPPKKQSVVPWVEDVLIQVKLSQFPHTKLQTTKLTLSSKGIFGIAKEYGFRIWELWIRILAPPHLLAPQLQASYLIALRPICLICKMEGNNAVSCITERV